MAQSASSGGQGAGNNRYVKFTRQAGQRIAKAVQAVEDGNRDQGPLAFGFRGVSGVSGKVFRVCTYTGAWNIGETKTVTFKYKPNPPNTAAALNLFFPITNTATENRDCAIAKDGTAWFLVDVSLGTATAVFARTTATSVFATRTQTGVIVSGTASSAVITRMQLSGSLNSSCNVVISSTPTTSTFTFITATASGVFVMSTATGIFMQSTYTATFLTFGA